MFNFNDKTNRSIADVARKVMETQPAEVKKIEPVKPIESDMVNRVLATGLGTNFSKIKEGNLEALQSDYATKLSGSIAAQTLAKNKKEKKNV